MKYKLSTWIYFSIYVISLIILLFSAFSLSSDYGFAHDKLFGDSIYDSKNIHSDPMQEGPPSAIFVETASCAFSLHTNLNILSNDSNQGESITKEYPESVDMQNLPEMKVDTSVNNAKEVKVGAPPEGWEKLNEEKNKEQKPDDEENVIKDKE